MSQIIFILLSLITFGFFGFTCWKVYKLFQFTKPEDRFDKIGERVQTLLLIAFGQTKMMKRPLAGILHAFVYWGFLVLAFGTLEMIIDGITGTERVLSFLGWFYNFITASGEIFGTLIIVSCIIFVGRRFIAPPKRFIAPEMKPSSKYDATFILAMIFILMISLLSMNTGYLMTHTGEHEGFYPVSTQIVGLLNLIPSAENFGFYHSLENVNWWIHISVIYVFLNVLPYSKHFHVLSSMPNVFFTRLEPYAKLKNMESVKREVELMMNPNATPPEDTGAPVRFGVKDPEDVTWKTLLDSYTCTECGRCTAVCPANTTGKVLSPRKLFKDLRRRMKDKGNGLIAQGLEYTDGKSLISEGYITEEELWACTTCMACIEECPVDIDHVPFIIDLRRNLVMEESKVPSALAGMFSNIENNGAPWQFSPADRMLWAEELEINVK